MIPHISSSALAALTAVSFVGAALAQVAPVTSVMTPINIDSGQRAGEISDVNGSIHIGESAIVGHVRDVNGSIDVDEKAAADSVGTVNGSVHLGPGAHVAQAVSTVNGSITVESGADVAGSVSAVNGSMTVTSAHVGGELTNVNGVIRVYGSHVGGSVSGMNGGIEIGPNSRVDGGLHVHRNDNNGWFNWWSFLGMHTPPRVVVGPGAVISGKLQFDQEVRLYVSDQATVGPIEGATPIKFSGRRPPD
jgi:cytoskeletal protein CcmA (bactofilin family)